MLNEFQKYTASPEFQELLQRYEKSREEDSECYIDLNDIIDIAEYYHSIEAFDEAEAAADYCHRLYPDNDSPLLFKARMALIDYGDYEKAEKIYSSLPQKDDSVEEAYVYAEILVCRNKVKEAETFLDRKYEDLKRQYEESVDTSGRVDSYDDEFEEEIEDFLDVLEHFPLDIAMMYSDHGLPDYAEKWLKLTDGVIEDMEFEYWETWGRTYHMQERFKEAIEAWNKALDVDSYSFSAWIHLCDAQYQENLIDDAIQSAEFAQAISVDDPQPNMFLGALHLEKNDTAKGVEEFLKTIEKSGYDLAVMIRVGLAFYELGYMDAALNMMEMIKKPFEEADMMSECPPIVQEIIDKCISDEKK
jgi:tetratricopeptide (TPR) repeat protein